MEFGHPAVLAAQRSVRPSLQNNDGRLLSSNCPQCLEISESHPSENRWGKGVTLHSYSGEFSYEERKWIFTLEVWVHKLQNIHTRRRDMLLKTIN